MLYGLATEVLIVPYLLNGFDLKGWDCRGLVSWCRREWQGKDSPGMDGYYPAEQATNLGEVESLILERTGAWEPCSPKPGSVALFRVRQRISHIAFMLDDHRFLHARENYNTTTDSLLEKKWSRRLEGTYELR